MNWINRLLIDAPPLLLAITLHEAAHGYAAKHFGDNTAYFLGRVSLNPLRHIDPIGTLLIPLVLKLSGSPFLFGYAKPVPVNFNNLRNPKRDMVWVALAGPASNMIQAFVWAVISLVFAFSETNGYISAMARAGILWNIILAVFNLFPLPPLDGGRILVGLLPYPHSNTVAKIEPYGFFIVLGLAMAGILGDIWIDPLTNVAYAILSFIFTPISKILTFYLI
jgi:Zn-dependent protease